jgi:hypothetical protein
VAEFQYPYDKALPASITLVVGNSVPLKLIPGKGESVPIAITVLPETIAKVTQLNVRVKANFTTFHLDAVKAGTAKMQAGAAKDKAISVTVEAALALPAAGTDLGLLVRLMLAETPTPDAQGYSDADAKTAMSYMRLVVANRLAKPSNIWGSAGAKTLADVVKAEGQFAGFSQYPTIRKGVQDLIDENVKLANDGGEVQGVPRSRVQRGERGAARGPFAKRPLLLAHGGTWQSHVFGQRVQDGAEQYLLYAQVKHGGIERDDRPTPRLAQALPDP